MSPPGFGRYELIAELRRDRFTVWYKARDPRHNQLVTLKILQPDAIADPGMRERFLRESRALASVEHPGVVRMHDVGEHEGCVFQGMEWVDGEWLDEKWHGEPWPVATAARLVEQMARGVAVLHRQGILHRDLHPGVIRVRPDGRPKLMSCLWCRAIDAGESRGGRGGRIGTPGYVAPELAGDTACPVEPAADIFSLGAILYALTVGTPPGGAAPAPASALPLWLEALLWRCLAPDPGQRHLSANALADELHRMLDA